MARKRWQFPTNGWVKVNVDGSVLMNGIRVSIGRVIRGPNGGWLVDFGNGDGDNVFLINTLRNGLVAISRIGEVRMIHDWCSKDWKVKFQYILMDINKVVDSIAKEAEGGIGHLIVLIDLRHT
ncbi:hypothetical protein ES332_A12G138200v1 [Gossypium tomentosum]|uniref:RNase H type-1 domain-containing protein n=1 Tax=Gossypium tomentosum TaxID=34277 RepID=A0A5D2MWD7_GOSTO|nr:hypothetical protein ES332_A12G138200v1 [Gossypium tomentosum]